MNKPKTLREKTYQVIFGTDTPAGRNFDLLLICAILLSVFAIMLDSIEGPHLKYGAAFLAVEWFFTLLFTVEYATRLWCSPNPKAYARGFYGIVDLLTILPTYIALFFPSASLLLVVRLLRVLRIFRVLKLFQYMGETNVLMRSLLMARRKIFVFLFSISIIIVIFGSLMYVVEGPEYGFINIPTSIYWAVVTITTVGYGDITPHTNFGRIIASLAMLTGYAILAVPTGIISAELVSEMQKVKTHKRCKNCDSSGHDSDAVHCKYCGVELKL
ncbi:putative Potassium voltage-gated channel subfamily KQT; potassium channel, VIC family [Candidatus Nitrotoga sp. BS]|uniref:ion transporter n=1 Tax=Candidatus Nitrotoga sp. BS TaxID=2890408 RepID=UPI001EF2AFF2|nr:ion transporter [Candidatus Nitrotoga sp. BS]CAH1211089.1 putative Potassium voltage-gated channel subfamily KQT; potassium channel, VIC family [Candidatus Nitrotoga sp. BS]